MTPRRIQLRRTKGWRKPEGAVVVARPSKWGNPFVVHQHTSRCGSDPDRCPVGVDQEPVDTIEGAVRAYRYAILYPVSPQPPVPDEDSIRRELRGRDLACWCPLDSACHADVLLELANA